MLLVATNRSFVHYLTMKDWVRFIMHCELNFDLQLLPLINTSCTICLIFMIYIYNIIALKDWIYYIVH